jgi:CMP-N,N'-diacetyllegionaminic acid synthase
MSLQVLGIVPARGGSRGIPQKNIAPLGGRPLIAWTIQAARSSMRVSRLVVSTDDNEIARIAKQSGAEVPFLRPSELARDDTPGIAPILHTLNSLKAAEGYVPDMVMCLQPTSPFRSADDIDAAVELAERKNADAVVSVTSVDHHPDWMRCIDSEGRLTEFGKPDPSISRRQDLPPVYALNGAIYLAAGAVLLARESWYTDKTYAYVMPEERSLDIDTPWQLRLADLILKDRLNDENG